MADIEGSICMDMKDYGMEGIVTLRMPRLTRRKQSENAIGRLAKVKGDTINVTETSLGDVQTLMVLTYVESAPFPHDLYNLDAFYAFCDKMDDKELGSATRFWNDLEANVNKLVEGVADPSHGSAQGSRTESSD